MVILFSLFLASSAFAESIIIVPPKVTYFQGYQEVLEECRSLPHIYGLDPICKDIKSYKGIANDPRMISIGELGRSVYFSIQHSVSEFNGGNIAKSQRILYNIIDVVVPSFKFNDSINEFYGRFTKRNNEFLCTTSKKKDASAIIWANFNAKAVKKLLSSGNNNWETPLNINIYFHKSGKVMNLTISLCFDRSSRCFTNQSLENASNIILKAMEEHHLTAANPSL